MGVSERLKKYGLRAKKQLGQHFLTDPSILNKIATSGLAHPTRQALELGPGPGGLTEALLDAGYQVIAIEKDSDMVTLLNNEFTGRPLSILESDMLKCDFEKIASENAVECWWAYGNLPYNISSQILIKLLAARHLFSGFTLMFQKEMADRIRSAPNTKGFGTLSVYAGIYADVKLESHLPAGAFQPPPKVTSSVLHFEILQAPRYPIGSSAALTRVVRSAFSQRRKTIKNSLSSGFSKIEIESLLLDANIEPHVRAETLSLEQFAKLAACAHELNALI